MNRSFLKLFVALAVLMAFTFVSVSSFAADKKWFVVKDTKGVCKVIQAKEKTPKSIAGPFDKKDDAEKAKKEQCPKKDKKENAPEKKR